MPVSVLRVTGTASPSARAAIDLAVRAQDNNSIGRVRAVLTLVACGAQGIAKLRQEIVHVVVGGQRTHDSDAEDLAGQGTEASGDLDAVVVQQLGAHFGVVHT